MADLCLCFKHAISKLIVISCLDVYVIIINDAIFENAIQKVDNINDKDAKSSMLFAISKVYHDNNMYAEASKHLIKGKQN